MSSAVPHPTRSPLVLRWGPRVHHTPALALWFSRCSGRPHIIMATAGDEARRRIDEVKFRNTGGNMEGIPGFNLEYNDNLPEPEEDVIPVGFPSSAPPPPVPPKYFQRVALRHEQLVSKTRKFDTVRQTAAGRSDARALRAKDGAVHRMPYKVVLKSADQHRP